MEPSIRYAKRPDGARTAYAVMGSGPVLIVPPGGSTYLDWYLGDTPAHETFCARLAKHRTVVLYDRHGCGLSDRDRASFTPEDDMKDIEAVVDALGRPEIDLLGISWGGSPALAYAAKHPEGVRRMVLYGTFASGRLGPGAAFDARQEALEALRRTDRELYTKTMASQFFPSGTDPETFQSLARMLQESTTPEMDEKLQEVQFDTQSVLADITIPVLVAHRKGDQVCLFVWGQYMARRLPNARFLPLEGDAHFPWAGDSESVLRPTIEFLTETDSQGGQPTVVSTRPERVPNAGLVTILFTDMQSSTELAQQLGDEAAQEVRRAHNEIVRAALSANGGAEIKHTGDGIMASFATASSGLECAIVIQRAVATHREEHPGSPLALYIGLNAGEPIAEEDPDGRADLFGTAVNLAARICDHAEAGQILVPDAVRHLAAGKGFLFADIGDVVPKGFEDPVRLFEVRWREA